MSRKKKRQHIPSPPPKFAEGMAIRVKSGTMHPHYPDIPMGGWAGEIVAVNATVDPPTYEIEWSEETLQRVHPIVEWRCERDDRSFATTWLREPDLEADPDPRAELAMEQPRELRPRPLDPTDPSDTVRAVFGLTSDDDLPPITMKNLRRYYEQLSVYVRFPVPALWLAHDMRGRLIPEPIMIQGLAPLEDITIEEGLFVTALGGRGARMTVPLVAIQSFPHDHASQGEIEAYRSWYIEQPVEPEAVGRRRTPFLLLATIGIMVGLVIGTAIARQSALMLHRRWPREVP